MEDKKTGTFYNIKRDEETPICMVCECPIDVPVHCLFWKCPLFENELICYECCVIGCLKKDVTDLFSQKLGRKITLDEINEKCKECGRNYAFQDEFLAIELESEQFNKHQESKDGQKNE